jgi:RNA polymerase sigma-70 factor (ECF subfamily)
LRNPIYLKLSKEDIQRIQQQDERYILKLYNDSFPLMMSVAVRYKNNREDQLTSVHNSFMKMLRYIDQFRLNSSFEAWILRILRNELIDEFRRTNKQSNLKFTELNTDIPDQHFELEYLENAAPTQLLQLLNELPPASKIVFNLYAIDDYSIKQISEALEISTETVKWHLKTSRKTLRARISTLKTQDHENE